ncbi:Arc family DNA-binding protein [Mesorhizobium sp.]|uniref:Arc family DNA-binding protein n=1 Tax=Mesorhizobium sp. TaxID=1871066 RepID=UPI0011F6C129|nr:Arc family DNA-binding protein [Mesorhizobium sp.]TIL36187.1 MAG: Arc family DNA-binding protein [Mesorhizobium sp.]
MPQSDDVKIRMPPEMKRRLKSIAADNGRSMNAEILARIEQSFELAGADRAKAVALVTELKTILEKGSG